MKLIQTKEYLLLIDEEADIGKGRLFYDLKRDVVADTAWTTTNKVLIIAYYPLTKEAKKLDLPLLPNPFEEVDVEKLALKKLGYENDLDITNEAWEDVNTFIRGYKAAQPKQFSLEDVVELVQSLTSTPSYISKESAIHQVENYLQSLSTQQLPKGFIISDEFSTLEENIKNGKYKW